MNESATHYNKNEINSQISLFVSLSQITLCWLAVERTVVSFVGPVVSFVGPVVRGHIPIGVS
jgi:hypothetical protein